MGKITVVVAVLLAVPVAASAQDFGIEWLDRVTHERQVERGPLKPHPVDWSGSAGVLGYLDNNVLLLDKDGKTPGDVVIMPFVRGKMEYTEQRFDASADLMVNYKGYMDVNHDPSVDMTSFRDWEERFYGHARYVDARWQIGVDEILRNESDPVNAVFLTRAKRAVSDTAAQASYDLTKNVAIESHLNYQVVNFYDEPFSGANNNENYRVDASLVYRMANGYDWLVQVGWMSIFYDHSQPTAPPDADGYYVRGGFRGEVTQRLSIEALAGWITVTSDRYVNTTDHSDLSTADIQVNIRYEASDEFKLFLDYARTITWAGAGDPWQVVNLFAAIAEWDCTEEFTMRARIQWDATTTASHIKRDYQSIGLAATYRFSEHVAADGGITYRTGGTHGNVATAVNFDDCIGHLGIVFTY